MKVSILVTYYNDRKFLPTLIESILNQSFKDFELVLVNHASTDDSRDIAHSYNDPRIIHMDMERNYEGGSGIMSEKFLKIAKGQYVHLMCADDVLYPDGLKDLVYYMDTHPEKDFTFGNVEYLDEKGRSKKKNWFSARPKFSLNNDEMDCLRLYAEGTSFLPYIGTIIKKEVFEKAYFDKSVIYVYDMLLWASLLAQGYKIGFLNKIVAGYRIHKGQTVSPLKAKSIFQKIRYEHIKYIDLFINIDDVNILRKIYPDNVYLKRHDDFSKFDLKFIVCYEYALSNNLFFRLGAYAYLHDMLQDDNIAKHLEEKFNFTIKEFRKIYFTFAYDEHSSYNEFTITEIMYILFKKFLKVLTFSKLRNRSKKAESM